MSHNRNPSSNSLFGGAAQGRPASATGGREKTYFEQQRESLVMEIATSFEHVLANINKLNRGLEATVAVGNEFSSVEALWSQFESVMAQKEQQQQHQQGQGQGQGQRQGQGSGQEHEDGGGHDDGRRENEDR
ncbi:putative dash complex subunit dad1 protein [Zalerion maritima]|uniref:DASH complex subunit DAD1 n=1 Tax=Zalerion maritima TaxID=339359 RepID=A0AAD5WQ65_9PEZI|nr:putative dash complex subunit dad1 protein [Zalerion maritima]